MIFFDKICKNVNMSRRKNGQIHEKRRKSRGKAAVTFETGTDKAACPRFTKAMDECAKISYNKERIFADRKNPIQGQGFEEGKEERYHAEAV